MGLFTFSEKVGLGLPLWLPKGAIMRQKLITFLQKVQTQAGYQLVTTPHIAQKTLYEISGHYVKYSQDSFKPMHTPKKDEEFMLKPMNCPHHCEIYNATPKSYKDLPLRLAEFGTVYRYEQHGELHGLTRVRGFTQDDAHIFCTPDKIKEEFNKAIEIILFIFNTFGFTSYKVQLSLRDPNNVQKYIGNEKDWVIAEKMILEAVQATKLHVITVFGEAAFYGPKLDFMVKDALGRNWQLGTIQLDYQLPQRFGLTYTGADNKKHRPVMIHRALFGSIERFIAILIEHTGGKFPVWLTPQQVIVLPISEKYAQYAHQVHEKLIKNDIQGTVDDRDEKIGRKIREAELNKIPYMLVVGEKEQYTQQVAVRQQGQKKQGIMILANFIQLCKQNIPSHNIDYIGS